MGSRDSVLKALFAAFMVILALMMSYYWARRDKAENAQKVDAEAASQRNAGA